MSAAHYQTVKVSDCDTNLLNRDSGMKLATQLFSIFSINIIIYCICIILSNIWSYRMNTFVYYLWI